MKQHLVKVTLAILVIITIASVWNQVNAQATVTGETTITISQAELNKLKGEDGYTPKITVSNTTTLSPGSPAQVIPNYLSNGDLQLSFGIPAGKDGANKPSCVYLVYTAADWDSAIAGLKAGKVTKIEVMQTDIKKNVSIPKTWAGNSKYLIIEGNGAYHDGWIKQEKPATQSEAENEMTQFKVDIIHLAMQAPQDTCIVLYGGYNNTIENNRFRKAKQAVYLGFCMNALVQHNDAVNMTGTAFELDRLYVSGAGTSNSCSNNSLMQYNRVFNANGSYAAFSSKAANNADFYRNIVEGGQAQFGIITDDQGSTTCKIVLKRNNHFEFTPLVADMQDKLNDGLSDNSGNWFQKPSPLRLNIISGAGAIVNFNNHSNLLSTDKINLPVTAKLNMLNNKRVDLAGFFAGTGKPPQNNIVYFYQNGMRTEFGNYTVNGLKYQFATP